MVVPAQSQGAQRSKSSTPAVVRKLPSMENRHILDGRYQILELIGHGAWGACYSAKPLYDCKEQLVAVKCIPTSGFSDNKRVFIDREILFHERVTDIGHNNILNLIEHGEDEDQQITFIVTELCAKGDLFAGMKNHRLSGRHGTIRRRMLQIVDAVHAMHERGIYHRDLKPENVFVRQDRSIAVGDFGFATDKRITDETKLGTSRYMSPEVLEGLYLRLPTYSPPPSDVWAIGVILLNLVTGRSCWERASLKDSNFRYYVKEREKVNDGLKPEPEFFSMLFDIPDEVDRLFNDIFTLSPNSRIKLPELRERLASITSFGSGKVKVPFEESEEESCVSADLSAETIVPGSSVSISSLGTKSSDEICKSLESPPVEPDNMCFETLSSGQFTNKLSASLTRSDSDDSGEESDGPETPETHATENVCGLETDIESLDLSAPTCAIETTWAKLTENWSPSIPQAENQPHKRTFGLVQLDPGHRLHLDV